MKFFVKFTENGVEQMGSDSVFKLDGRNCLTVMIADAKERLERLRCVKPRYNGFKIMKGDMRSSVCKYEERPSI